MFPSHGYFKGIDCPYFVSGLCERPHCHFRHVKNDDPAPAQPVNGRSYLDELGMSPMLPGTSNSNNPQSSSLLNTVNDAIRQMRSDIVRAGSQPVTRLMKYDMVRPNVGQAKYKPTPINKKTGKVELGQRAPSQNRPMTSRLPVVPVPEYRPTPIHLLKQRHNGGDSIEPEGYDPVSNFSTSHTAFKRITLGNAGVDFTKKRKMDKPDPSSIQPKRPKIVKPEAKFSSDEDDESGKPKEQKTEESKNKEDSETEDTDKAAKDTEKITEAINKEINGKKEKDEGADIDKESDDTKKSQPDSMEIETDLKSDIKDSERSKKVIQTEDTNNDTSTSSPQAKKREQRTESSESEKGKTNGKDSEKENADKSSTSISSKHRHKSSQRSSSDKKPHDATSKSKDKRSSSSSSHHNSSKSKPSSSTSSRSKSSSHSSTSSKLKSSTLKYEKSSSTTKHKSSKEANHKNDKETKHKSDKETKHKSDKETKHKSDKETKHKSDKETKYKSDKETKHKSSKDSQSVKDSKSKHKSSSSKPHASSSKSAKTCDSRRTSNIFEAFDHPPQKVQRKISHVDLFGEDSDTEYPTPKPGISRSYSDSDTDDDDFIEISLSSVESDDAEERKKLLTAEDYDFEVEDPYDECYKIFKEKSTSTTKAKPPPRPSTPVEEKEYVPVGKVRVARADEDRINMLKREAAVKRPHVPSPAEVMHNRFIENQRRAALMAEGKATNTGALLGKKRVARFARPMTQNGASTSTAATSSAFMAAAAKRVAHVPPANVKIPRPVIPKTFGKKVPVAVRQKALNRIIDDCQKIYPEDKDAYERGLAEEETVYQQSSSKILYMNKVMIALKRLREEAGRKNDTPTSPTSPNKPMKPISHAAVLGGKNAANCTYTLNRSGGPVTQAAPLTGGVLYKLLAKYILTEDQLVEHGFPRPTDQKGKVSIKPRVEKKMRLSDKNERYCSRCGKRFKVIDGRYEKREKCTHHWGKCWSKLVNRGVREHYWTCCNGGSDSKGCEIADYHVNEDNKWEDVTGYQSTLAVAERLDGYYGIYAVDCEMVLTVVGSEVARITVVNEKCEQVLDLLVKPQNKIVHYNTRFSGLTKESLVGVTTTLQEAQAMLLSMFNAKTILIGHSLESDLVAVKLLHSTVVDTSVVYPHRNGLPYKRALRNLAEEHLQKIIQNSLGGHDSMEDAATAMELMMVKAKDDARRMKGRRI